MKRQFANIQPSQGKQSPEQAIPAASPPEAKAPVPPVRTMKTTGGGLLSNNGLLSNWQKGGVAPSQGPISEIGNTATPQQVTQRPVTNPISPMGQGFFPSTAVQQVHPGVAQSQVGNTPILKLPISSADYNTAMVQPPPSQPMTPINYQNNGRLPGPPSTTPSAAGNAYNTGFSGMGSVANYPGEANTRYATAGPGYPSAPYAPGSPNNPPYANVAGYPNHLAYQGRPSSAGYFNNTAYPGASPPTIQSPNKGRRKRRFPIWARVVVATLAVLLLASSGGYAYYQANYAAAVNSITGNTAIHHVKNAAGTSVATQVANTGGTLTGGRINILLLGSDNDGKGNNGADGAPLAQTDIVVTIDPQTGSVGMLSIPRDLQVTIPNNGSAKMDAAFSYGFQEGGSSSFSTNIASAAGLAEDTIAYNFGIHINYYAWVGLEGFVKVIQTAGGVDINAIHPMVDDVYPADVNNQSGNIYDYERLYIAPGPQHMDGEEALSYVRTRHSDLVGDFGRSARQQQVLTQLKTKLATPATIAKAPQLLTDLKGSLLTDLTSTEMIEMANYARNIDTNKIDRVTLSPPTYSTAGLSGGNYAPVCAQVEAVIAKMFDIQPDCIPQTSTAATTGSSTTGIAHTTTSTDSTGGLTLDSAWQMLGRLGNIDFNPLDHFTVIHSMLDLLFMITCESFDGEKV